MIKRLFISLFSFLSWLVGGLGAFMLTQINSKFEDIKQDPFLKQQTNTQNNVNSLSTASHSPWSLIYASGSFSFLKRLMDQIRLDVSPASSSIHTSAGKALNPAENYPESVRALMLKFLQNLDYSVLISPIEKPEESKIIQATNSDLRSKFLSFRAKFSHLNFWLEAGVYLLVLESFLLFSLFLTSSWFWVSSSLSYRKKLKQLLLFYLTNLFSYSFEYVKKLKIRNYLSGLSLEIEREFTGLQLRGLNYSKDGEKILKDIDLTILRGEFYSIIGPNGAGKTTLLQNIAGLLTPQKGELKCSLVEEKEKEFFCAPNYFWRSVVYIPQELNIQGDTSVYDFLLYSRFIFLKRLERARVEDHISVLNALKICELQNLRYSRMGELSGGQKQKVILASIIVQSDADLILLDEPTTHLDIENRKFLLSFFKELSKAGKTIVANLHNFVEISELSTKIIAVKEGKIEKVGEKKDVLTSRFLNHLYGLKLSDESWERFCSPSIFNY